jgi:hypothetical protein
VADGMNQNNPVPLRIVTTGGRRLLAVNMPSGGQTYTLAQ